MPLSENVASLMEQSGIQYHQEAMGTLGVIDRNLAQVAGVINDQAVGQTILSSDDATLMAALQTASRVPVQGSNDLPK